MKKALAILLAISFCAIASYVIAAEYSQTDNVITVDASGVTDADNIEFQASAQVTITGASDATAFAHAAHHNQVVGKENGRQFGMASDDSSVFWQSIEDANDLATITGTTSDEFTSWNRM